MYLAKRSNLSPFSLRNLILIEFVFRPNIKSLLLALEFLCCIDCDFNSFVVFGKQEGLYGEVDDVADTSNPMLNSVPAWPAFLQEATEFIVAAVIIA